MGLLHGFGLGIASENAAGDTLDVFYPQPLSNLTGALCDGLTDVAGRLDSAQLRELATMLHKMGENTLGDLATRLAESDRPIVAAVLADNHPARSVDEAYLKLHLLSHRLVKPHQTDLTGLFGLLPNVAWTDQGPVDLTELPQRHPLITLIILFPYPLSLFSIVLLFISRDGWYADAPGGSASAELTQDKSVWTTRKRVHLFLQQYVYIIY